MRLALSFPPTLRWIHKEAPANQRAAILPGDAVPELVVTYGPLSIRPDEPRAWMERIARDAPPDARVTLGRTIEGTTRAGWPLHLVEVAVTDADGSTIEVRLCAFYTFLEHAAVAIVRARDHARLEAHGATVRAILESGLPDWRTGPACLVEAWDLERPRRRHAAAIPPSPIDDELLATACTTVADHVRRAKVLLGLGRTADALESVRTALALDPSSEAAHYMHGVVLGAKNQHAEAIEAWQRVLARAPEDPDTHYNIGLAHYLLAHHAAALAAFRRAHELAPTDFFILCKLAQCYYALERFDEGFAVREQIRACWASSTDVRVRLVHEYVFDQFAAPGVRVHALEALREASGPVRVLLAFRPIGDDELPVPVTLVVETSEPARRAGTPFVLGLLVGRDYRGVGTLRELPAYPVLKAEVSRILGEALRAPP